MILLFLILSVVLSMNETLRDAGDRFGLFVGAAGGYSHITSDQTYHKMLGEQFNMVTAENACKWGPTERKQGEFDFTQCDYILNYANDNKMTFRGHNLCWGSYNPDWLNKLSPSEKAQALGVHIHKVLEHYQEKGVYGWDVVNEAVSEDGSGYKDSDWYPDVKDYVTLAFNVSRAVDPKVKLFYKVGLQMHVSNTFYPSYDEVNQNIKRLVDLGLEVHITEMDVGIEVKTHESLEKQKEIYEMMLNACLNNYPGCKAFITWGFTDKFTWRGTEKHPLPFDENYEPKPAAEGLLSVLQKV